MKRDRSHLVEDCPKCKMPKGVRCINYRGVNKQPCRLNVETFAQACQVARRKFAERILQQTLLPFMTEGSDSVAQ